MSKKGAGLASYFLPEKYRLEVDGNACRMTILGRKLPPPSKRITLHQKGMKIRTAEITSLDKKQQKAQEVIRINHLPTFQEVRLHTADTIYPGQKRIVLEYRLSDAKLELLRNLQGMPSRELMPSIDEDILGAGAEFELIYTNGQK